MLRPANFSFIVAGGPSAKTAGTVAARRIAKKEYCGMLKMILQYDKAGFLVEVLGCLSSFGFELVVLFLLVIPDPSYIYRSVTWM